MPNIKLIVFVEMPYKYEILYKGNRKCVPVIMILSFPFFLLNMLSNTILDFYLIYFFIKTVNFIPNSSLGTKARNLIIKIDTFT